MATSPPSVENTWLQPPPEMSLHVYSRRGQSRTRMGFILQEQILLWDFQTSQMAVLDAHSDPTTPCITIQSAPIKPL